MTEYRTHFLGKFLPYVKSYYKAEAEAEKFSLIIVFFTFSTILLLLF